VTITLASVFARGSLVLSRFARLRPYARDLRTRALAAWKHCGSHAKSDACDDGTIKSGDADVKLEEQDARAVVADICSVPRLPYGVGPGARVRHVLGPIRAGGLLPGRLREAAL